MNVLFASDASFYYFDGTYPGDSAAVTAMAHVKPYFEEADFSVLNLESTFGNKADYTPIIKSGPNQISAPEFIRYLEEISPSAVCLANNHTGDLGAEPIFNTMDMLDRVGISYFGVGENTDKAYEPVLFEKDGVNLAIIGVCENEFGTATDTKAGSAGYSLGKLTKAIHEASEKGYLPIVFFHGGNEHYAFPSPKKRELYRHFVDIGAGAVIAMHTHCPQGYEMYNGAPIVYSMGNIFFPAPDYPARPRFPVWAYGYMTQIDFTSDGSTLTIIPYKQSFEGIEILSGKELDFFNEYMEAISRPIQDRALITDYFETWAVSRDFLELIKYNEETLSSPQAAAQTKNLFGCEAHNEVLTTHARVVFEGRTKEVMQRLPVITALQNMTIPEELK